MNETKGFLKTVHPVLSVWDVSKAITFYVDRLGFGLAFSDDAENPHYAGVRRDGVELHLQWHDPSEWEPAIDRPMLRFPVDDIQALYEDYGAQHVFHERTSLRETPWGTQEFAFYDPFGNGLVFFRDL